MVLKIFLFASIFLFQISLYSQVEIDTSRIYKMSEILVTATRTKTPSLELANSITVIDSNEIAQKKETTVYDLLKNEYGLSLARQLQRFNHNDDNGLLPRKVTLNMHDARSKVSEGDCSWERLTKHRANFFTPSSER